MLTDDNFLQYAMHHYDNPTCKSIEVFNDDLYRIVYIKKLLNRMQTDEKVSLRLVLNHFVILFNSFGAASIPMLFLKIDRDRWPFIKTFLVFLGQMPEFIPELILDTTQIEVNERLLKALERL